MTQNVGSVRSWARKVSTDWQVGVCVVCVGSMSRLGAFWAVEVRGARSGVSRERSRFTPNDAGKEMRTASESVKAFGDGTLTGTGRRKEKSEGWAGRCEGDGDVNTDVKRRRNNACGILFLALADGC